MLLADNSGRGEARERERERKRKQHVLGRVDEISFYLPVKLPHLDSVAR